MHYFAYGNLMDIDLMRSVAPSARPITVARLPDHELRFAKCNDPTHGGCTLIHVDGAETWGVHYEMSDEDMAAMDASAGVAEGRWAHKPVTVYTSDGQSIDSVTYFIPNDRGPHQPPESYVGPIHKGAKALGLPKAYRDRLHAIIDEATAAAS
ncbi:gamma-glutamylcyclotransferase family protein [Pararhodobacter sp. SW119]|uniref:gamma-glutamylcyclotransferase family protein n=1 Tax=Pararhodobacter sp. SW119 TaxID=2780075 RepID=UPI001AE06001|nr:gamma-glutamylcyclotransferase family protein [Pararhodobacter sp. SW119]